MMKKRLLKFMAIAACSLTVAAVGVGAASSFFNDDVANADYEFVLDDATALKTEYQFEDLLAVPTGTINGVAASDFVVIAPSGKAYNTETLILNEVGVYTIRWYAVVNGKTVSTEKTFKVKKDNVTVSGTAEWEYTTSLSKYTGKAGLKVALEPGAVFTYNKAIDLSQDSAVAHVFPYHAISNITDITEQAKIKSEAIYNEDARNYYITLTDCYDPTNYVKIDIEWAEKKVRYNFRAAAAGQKEHGLNKNQTNGTITIDDDNYALYYAPTEGNRGPNTVDEYGIQFFYDNATNRIYASYHTWAPWSSTAKNNYNVKTKTMIADLSNELIYPGETFKGFTTGEVFISISAQNILASAANIEIASLGTDVGEDMMQLKDDTLAPVIQVNEDLKEFNKIALNEEVAVPTATALDLNLPYGTKANAAVYYQYTPGSTNNTLVGLVNGKFTPKRKGLYTIVYTAMDQSGNVGTKTVDLQCQEATGNSAIQLSVDATMDADAGKYIQLPECTVSGIYTDASRLKVYVGDPKDGVLVKDNKVFLEGVKQYTLTYAYETPFKTYTATCVVNAQQSDEVTMDTPVLPEYFIANAKYTLDTVYAYEYTSEKPVAVLPDVFMSTNGGTSWTEVNYKEVLIPNGATKVQFKYEQGESVVYTDEVKVVDVGFGTALQMQNLFYSEEDAFTKVANAGDVQYTVKAAGTHTLKYVNVLSMDAFDIEFALSGSASITFTLVDYYDRNNRVTLKLVQTQAEVTEEDENGVETTQTVYYTNVTLNGISKGKISNKAILGARTYISYDGGFKMEGNTYAFENTFTSDKMLLWVTVEDATANTSVNFNVLCDNTLRDSTSDAAFPTIYLDKVHRGLQTLGKVLTIGKANACDIVAPYVESGLTLTVKDANNKIMTSLDGVLLDGTCPVDREYQIKLDQLGTYSVFYEYYDQNGNYCTANYRPMVKDRTPPTITVEGRADGDIIGGTWGANIAVANYTVTDDCSEAENIDSCVEVFYPSGVMRKVDMKKGGTFYAEEKGDYTVFYFAYDEEGNYSTFKYIIRAV